MRDDGLDHVPLALIGMVELLPAPGRGWTQTERDRWLRVFVDVLDLCYPLAPEPVVSDGIVPVRLAHSRDDVRRGARDGGGEWWGEALT